MKRFLPWVAVLLATQVYAVSPGVMMTKAPNYLHNYEEVLAAVYHGQDIRIGFEFDKCSSDSKAKNAAFDFGVYTPNEIIVANSGAILASLNHFTLNDNNAKNQAVYQFARYKITADNNVVVSMQVLDAATWQPITPKKSFTCALNNGAYIVAK